MSTSKCLRADVSPHGFVVNQEIIYVPSYIATMMLLLPRSVHRSVILRDSVAASVLGAVEVSHNFTPQQRSPIGVLIRNAVVLLLVLHLIMN